MNRLPEQDNNFDFLRLAMALGVLISHQYSVAGVQPPSIQGLFYLGTSGVLGFFAISGYLVMGSWSNDPNIFRFAARRVLRMFPGLLVMTLLVVLGLGALVTTEPLDQYFSSPTTWRYFSVLRFWSFEENLPGVFVGNPGGRSVNASLWSIPIEVRCYLALMFAGALTLLREKRLLPAAILAYCVALTYLFSYEANAGLLKLYWELGIVFIVGVVLSQMRHFWQPHRMLFTAVTALLVMVLWWQGKLQYVYLTLMSVGIVLFGSARWPILSRFGRIGDLSYGTYIYGFPVQQAVVWYTHNQLTVAEGLAITVPLTLALAWLSWHCVESPALRLKKWIGKMRLSPRQ